MARKFELMPFASLAAVFTLTVIVLNWAFNAIGTPVKQLFVAVEPISPVSGTAGMKVLGWLGGIIPIGDLLGIGTIAVFLSSLIAIVVGSWLITNMRLPVARGRTGRLASIILWGTVPVYVLLVGITIPSMSAIVGVLIYTFVAAYITGFIVDRFKLKVSI